MTPQTADPLGSTVTRLRASLEITPGNEVRVHGVAARGTVTVSDGLIDGRMIAAPKAGNCVNPRTLALVNTLRFHGHGLGDNNRALTGRIRICSLRVEHSGDHLVYLFTPQPLKRSSP